MKKMKSMKTDDVVRNREETCNEIHGWLRYFDAAPQIGKVWRSKRMTNCKEELGRYTDGYDMTRIPIWDVSIWIHNGC